MVIKCLESMRLLLSLMVNKIWCLITRINVKKYLKISSEILYFDTTHLLDTFSSYHCSCQRIDTIVLLWLHHPWPPECEKSWWGQFYLVGTHKVFLVIRKGLMCLSKFGGDQSPRPYTFRWPCHQNVLIFSSLKRWPCFLLSLSGRYSLE